MAFTPQELQAGFRIGECLIQPRQNCSVRGDADVRVEPRVMDGLVRLAERTGAFPLHATTAKGRLRSPQEELKKRYGFAKQLFQL